MIKFRVDGGVSFDVNHAVDVFEQQRARFIGQLEQLSPEQWSAPTRCALWSVQHVVRHLCDVNERLDREDGDPISFDGFDPRTTPNDWLRPSDGEAVDATFERFRESTRSVFAGVRQRIASGDTREVAAPYGTVPWPFAFVHAYWDSWVHERDVLVPLGIAHPTDDGAVRLATAYAWFVTGVIAAAIGSPVTKAVALSGVGGGTYELALDGTAVVLTADAARASESGPDAVMVADILTGRGGSVVELLGDDAKPLAIVGDFFNTPV